MDTRILFARHLGEKVLYENKEYILYGITSGYALCINDKSDPFPVPFKESKLIFNSQEEFKETEAPASMSIVKTEIGYTDAQEETDIDRENTILLIACKCAGIYLDELYNTTKNRKRELVEVRQIHMTVRQRLTRTESLAKTGKIYGKDHATVLHAMNKIDTALNGFDINLREKYRPVFEFIKDKYGEKGKAQFNNLEWL
jgi:hypothetical protein